MWSASPPGQMAPQASDSADKPGLPAARDQLCPWEGRKSVGKGLCVAWWAEWCDGTNFYKHLKYEDVHWGLTWATPPSLYSAYWHGLCLSPCLFPLWNDAGGWQRSAKSLMFHTVYRPLPNVPTHCDIPWGALWFLLSFAGWVPGHQVSVPSGRIMRAGESVGTPWRRTNERAGLSTEGISGKWDQSWLCVHREGSYVQWKLSAWHGWHITVGSAAGVLSVLINTWVIVRCAQCVLIL